MDQKEFALLCLAVRNAYGGSLKNLQHFEKSFRHSSQVECDLANEAFNPHGNVGQAIGPKMLGKELRTVEPRRRCCRIWR